jgi:hypothetical protein
VIFSHNVDAKKSSTKLVEETLVDDETLVRLQNQGLLSAAHFLQLSLSDSCFPRSVISSEELSVVKPGWKDDPTVHALFAKKDIQSRTDVASI